MPKKEPISCCDKFAKTGIGKASAAPIRITFALCLASAELDLKNPTVAGYKR